MTLCHARGQEHRFARGHPARDGSNEKHRVAGQHASPAAEAIGERAGCQEGSGERKTVGVNDPCQTRDIQPNVLRDGGHGDDDRRHIEQDQEGA